MSDTRAEIAAWLAYAGELGIEALAIRLPEPSAAGGALQRMRASLGAAPDDGRRTGTRAAASIAAMPSPGRRPAPGERVAGGVLERLVEVPLERMVVPTDDAPVVAPGDLEEIRSTIGDCRRCRLHQGRTRLVFGIGDPRAELMFVGEGPGADEDRRGEPFVGRAGRLLNDIIKAIGMRREQVYIANVVKCRPPRNRTPEADEAATCRGFLYRQLAVIRPKIVVTLGRPATEALLDRSVAISRERGKVFNLFGARLVPTFHPAYLLRDSSKKRLVWEDMKLVRDMLAGKRGADGIPR